MNVSSLHKLVRLKLKVSKISEKSLSIRKRRAIGGVIFFLVIGIILVVVGQYILSNPSSEGALQFGRFSLNTGIPITVLSVIGVLIIIIFFLVRRK